MDGSNHRTGENEKVGAYVDSGIYAAFREWVEETHGKQYGNVGEALNRAMLEYMEDERVEDELREMNETVRHNNALLRKLRTELEKKEKSGVFSDTEDEDRGNAPGDRKRREAKVLNAVLSQGIDRISQSDLEKAIRNAADVSSDPTIDDYLRALSQTKALTASRTADLFEINHEAAVEFCREHDVPVETDAIDDLPEPSTNGRKAHND
jgi:hypothetical protein